MGKSGQMSYKKLELKSWVQKLRSVTIEPASFFMMISVVLSGTLMQNVLIESVCTVTRNNSREICSEIVKNNGSFEDEEIAIQEVVASVQEYSSIVDNVFKLLFILIAGPWSDRNGRRTPLILTVVGNTVSCAGMLAGSLLYDRIDPYWLAIITSAASSILGGEVGFTMSAYGHICDITNLSSRTFRTGMFSAAYQLGALVGFGLLNLIIRSDVKYPNTVGFGVALICSLITLVIVLIGLKKKTWAPSDFRNNNYSSLMKRSEMKRDSSTCGFLGSSLCQVFRPLTKPRSLYGKVVIWLIIILHILAAAPIHGDSSILYLFLRQRLGWDVVEYGYFSIYDNVIKVIGMSVAMTLFSKWLQASDPCIGFISGWSQLAASPAVDMLNALLYVIARSMLSKIVGKSDVGKAVSLTMIFETVAPLAFIPLYSWMYAEYVGTFPGSVFLLSAALSIPGFLIYLWFIFDPRYRNYEDEYNREDNEEERLLLWSQVKNFEVY
ncbi:Proton-coupled folate transporter [Folsomia candida]|uniref:Proton-coupled folate transporter n=1 Tax=Folsomia candida TaxID=158441 RepID=A0A226E3M5_FOLCA|nr:Proton-coupled folate transporter [Folsomia candida]